MRRACLLVLAMLALGLPGAVAASNAFASAGVWVTQRTGAAPQNVDAFTVGASDDLLSGPFTAGVADDESFGIAVTPLNQYGEDYVYVTNDNGASTISEYEVDPSTAALTALSQGNGFATADAAAGANPEDIAVDPTGSWAFSANPGSGSVTSYRINPLTGVLTPVQEFHTSASPSVTLTQPTGVAVSPDGHYLYVADFGSAQLEEFAIDLTTGALAPLATPSIAVPQGSLANTPIPDRITTATIGSHDYAFVTDLANDQVVEFTIDAGTGELAEAGWTSPDGASYANGAAAIGGCSVECGLVVNTAASPDPYLYVAADSADAIDRFQISPTDGSLPSASATADSNGPTALAIAPDGNELYAGSAGTKINLYTINSGGGLTADVTDPTYTAGDGPTNPAAAALPSPSPPGAPVSGTLSQLAYPNDCITSDGSGSGCNYNATQPPAGSLLDSYQPVVSPDGSSAYVVALGGDLDEFSRNATSGALTYIGCVGVDAGCGSVDGMQGPQGIAISPDGKSVYVVTSSDHALVTFSRDTSTGLLTFDACVSSTSATGCTTQADLDSSYGVAVSPDGTSVYVTSSADGAISQYARNTTTGALTFVADTTTSDLANAVDVEVSPDGDNVYVAGGGPSVAGDIVEFSRSTSTGDLSELGCITSTHSSYPGCATSNAIGFDQGSEDLAISPDGENVYVTAFGDNGVIELSRNTTTGVLTQLASPNGCISEETSTVGAGNPPCTQVAYPQEHGTAGALGVAVSPDGLNVYVSGASDNALAAFSRDPANSGALTPLTFADGCLTGQPQDTANTCPVYNVNGLYQPRRLVVSPDGGSVYVANQGGDSGCSCGGDGVVELGRTTPAASLAVAVSAPSSVTIGSGFTFTVKLTDNGPSDEYGVTLSNALPAGVTLDSVSSSQGSCAGTTMLSCNLGWLIDGSTATITLNVTAAATGTATDSASFSPAGDVADPSSQRTASASTTINSPQSAGGGGSTTPTPVLEQSTVVAPVSGSAQIKLPGSATFVALSSVTSIPMGSTINATHGTVAITVAEPNGTTETADFYDGEFVVTQDASGRLFATLAGGSFAQCPPAGKKGKGSHKAQLAAAKKSKTTVVRELWGSGHGAFTTKGRYGSAAVSGTIWLTEDRCDGTYFKVTKDTILVTAYAKPAKHHLVKQGGHYLITGPGF